ncbi:MAG: lipoyl synthase, partial [Candidatus Atribacteria bacterium]
LETGAQELGFKAVVAGPLVRSSYHAAAAYTET